MFFPLAGYCERCCKLTIYRSGQTPSKMEIILVLTGFGIIGVGAADPPISVPETASDWFVAHTAQRHVTITYDISVGMVCYSY